LRAGGLVTDYSLTAAKSDKQFKRAQELKAAHTIKLERSQTGELLAKIKDLRTRQETVVPASEAVDRLREPPAHS
jgi:histidyl-tRNA synthetase